MPDTTILIAALPIGGLSATEAASRLARAARSEIMLRCAPLVRPEMRTIGATHDLSMISQLPLADGGEGTIDLLVTNSLGSFLEVEATGASGEPLVVPLGFAGEDGKLGVIEMHRVARMRSPEIMGDLSMISPLQRGDNGTTYGVGELILDALDEGAFSVILGHDEPLACDAGLGAAAALGVKFFDKKGAELDMRSSAISAVERIDPTGRAFEILSSRFFIARSAKSVASSPSNELLAEIERLAEIVRRDVGIPVPTTGLSASAIEFGLTAFIGAEVRDGLPLILEATGTEAAMQRGEFSTFVLLAESPDMLTSSAVQSLLATAKEFVGHRTIVFRNTPNSEQKKQLTPMASVTSLAEAKLFSAPLAADAAPDAIRRDTLLRIEKIANELVIRTEG